MTQDSSWWFRGLIRSGALAFAIALSFASMASPARAGIVVDVNAWSGANWSDWQVNLPLTGDPLDWQLAAPVDLYSTTNPNVVIGTIKELIVSLDDPTVSLAFKADAGGVPTTFTISSGIVGFPALINNVGFATAAVTVTDEDSSADGATITGLFPGVKAYQAQYNGRTSVFANLVSPVTTAADNSNTGQERFPAVGSAPIAGVISDIESQFKFVLTANDEASGSSRFSVAGTLFIPEPSSLCLIALGALGLLVRCGRSRARSPH